MISILAVASISVAVWNFGLPIYFSSSSDGKTVLKYHEDMPHDSVLSSEIEAVLHNKLDYIAEIIAENPIIIETLQQSNTVNALLSIEDKINLDSKWRKVEGVDDFIFSFLKNPAAFELYIFQENNPGYPEIFITDASGLNVAQTNKTTDYYQADEGWWIMAYNDGAGEKFHGLIEYDESAQSESVSLHVPIYDPETGAAIGIIKAVVDMVGIKNALTLNE